MKKIVLAFQGTGKTFFCENHPDSKALDKDFKYFQHTDGWVSRYVDEIEGDTKHEIIFCNISRELMDELYKRDIPFTVFAPLMGTPGYEDIKSLIIGRCVLRKEQTPQNVWWIEKIKSHFDEWCDPEFFRPYGKLAKVIPVTLYESTVTKLYEEYLLPEKYLADIGM